MTISESKKALRKGILAKRRNLSEAYQKQAAQEIYEKLRALEVYKEASVLCLYVPIRKEVDLFQYIRTGQHGTVRTGKDRWHLSDRDAGGSLHEKL